MLTLSRGRYDLAEPLRMGPLTQTFRIPAADGDGRRLLAKQLHPWLAADEVLARRWLAKAAENAAIPGPGRVTVHDFGQEARGVFVVVDELDGIGLGALVSGLAALGRALPGEIGCHLAHAMLSALVPAHASSPPLAHLDLDPEAVIAFHDGSIALSELGLWDALAPAEASRLRLARGRSRYVAPEIARGERGSPASDVFSVGLLLCELLTGCHPFAGADSLQVAQAIGAGRRAPMRALAPVLSAALCDVLERMLAHAPDARFESAGVALAALAAVCPVPWSARNELALLVAGAGAASGLPSPEAALLALHDGPQRASDVHFVPGEAGERTSGVVLSEGARSAVRERAQVSAALVPDEESDDELDDPSMVRRSMVARVAASRKPAHTRARLGSVVVLALAVLLGGAGFVALYLLVPRWR